MSKFKNTEFAKELKISFADFKKAFKSQFTDDEMKEAYSVATNKDGNTRTTTKESKKTKSRKA